MVDQSRGQPLLATGRKLSLSFDPVVSASTGFTFIKYSRKFKEVIESSVLRNAFEIHFDHLKSLFVFHHVKSVFLHLPNI